MNTNDIESNVLKLYSSKRKNNELTEDIDIINEQIVSDLMPDEIKGSVIRHSYIEALKCIIEINIKYPLDVLHIKHQHTVKKQKDIHGFIHTIKYTLVSL